MRRISYLQVTTSRRPRVVSSWPSFLLGIGVGGSVVYVLVKILNL